MSMYINTNVSSLNAQRNLMNSSKSLDTSYTRLASGLRINSAKDDAAGLQIANRMTSQINGLNQGNRNANDGMSMAQTAEGAMEEVTGMLQRMRTLAQQSANGTNSSGDREALNKEVTALKDEITRISNDTTFAGTKLFETNDKKINFQVGADANQTISITLNKMDSTELGVGSFDISTSTGAQTALDGLDAVITKVDGQRADLGAVQNRLDSTVRNQSNVAENVSAARSRIRDADFATETANMTRQNILQQASSTILAQANQRPQSALQLLG
ncbi:flagellin [Aeromonas media]|uniref:flagellin N-terminal helical domain-containing protein n=1 Tax=Aeromonas media TaxID=651 RepID=UPI001F33D4D3|nr:flagellin [Aeromonas media]MCE9925254.1 flagellin [Aeromonas media]